MKTIYMLLIGLAIIGILVVGIVAQTDSNKVCEKKVEFYYNPSCPHCQKVVPLIKQYSQEYKNWAFYSYDVSQTSYKDVSSVPTIKVYPGDGREIILLGSGEIPKYLKCELEEKSTLECPTHLNLIKGSFFVK